MKKVAAAVKKSYGDNVMGKIMGTYSKDNGEIIRALPPDNMDAALKELFLKSGSKSVVVDASTDTHTSHLGIDLLSLPPMAFQQYSPFLTTVTNMFFPEAARKEVRAHVGLLPEDEQDSFVGWRVTAKVYPTKKALREAGIKEYTISHPLKALRAMVAIPIGTANDEVYVFDPIHTKPLHTPVVYSGERIAIFPPSFLRQYKMTCKTTSATSRLVDHAPDSRLLVFHITYVSQIENISIVPGVKLSPLGTLPIASSDWLVKKSSNAVTGKVVNDGGKLVRKIKRSKISLTTDDYVQDSDDEAEPTIQVPTTCTRDFDLVVEDEV